MPAKYDNSVELATKNEIIYSSAKADVESESRNPGGRTIIFARIILQIVDGRARTQPGLLEAGVEEKEKLYVQSQPGRCSSISLPHFSYVVRSLLGLGLVGPLRVGE